MMNPENLKKFKAEFCTALHQDEKNGSFYVKIPVKDYQELSLIRMALVTSIEQIIDLNDHTDNTEEIIQSVWYLNRILKHMDLMDECLGLTELVKG